MNVDKILTILKFTSCEIISENEFYDLLTFKKELIIKIGFDPTTERLHLGHVVLLRKLRLFQDFGYTISFLIGDFTAMIGDPSGRSDVRNQITRDVIINNFKTYTQQVFKILNPNLTIIYFNSSWLDSLRITSFIKLMSTTTVSRLLERNDFKERYLLNKPIYLNEFIYPLLQAYDSVFMNADIEFGGIDQKFNFLLTRNLQKKFGYSSQVVIMMPILKGLDGKNKMSKSLQNCINIDDNFYDMFCKVMSILDALIKDYYVFLNFLTLPEYELLVSKTEDFMALKVDLAFKIVSLFYDTSLAEEAKLRFINYFSKKNVFDNVVVTFFTIEESTILLSDFLVNFKFVFSHSEFKRLLKQGSIKVNSLIISDRTFCLEVNTHYFIKLGKKIVFRAFLNF
ncbi:MAG TPA: tyrosine--tRNA ligase [Candidatus Azoamicus sp.]